MAVAGVGALHGGLTGARPGVARVRPVVLAVSWVVAESLRGRLPYGGFPWLDMPQVANENWFNAHNFYGDLAELDLPARGITEPFDVIVCPGNVMVFLAPGTEAQVLRRMAEHLADEGRIGVGFHTNRELSLDDFDAAVVEAGLHLDLRLAT